jgi:transposase-like protein
MQTRKRHTKQERGRWLARFEESGKSAAAFSREHGIGYKALLNWRKTEREKEDVEHEEVKFVEVGLVAGGGESCTGARGADRPAAELELPGGILLRIFAPREESRR